MIKQRDIVYEKDTEFGRIQVVDTLYEDEPVSFLMVDGEMESAMYLKPEKKNELLFPYMKHFAYAFQVNPTIQDTYLIGGGGFSYPRYYLSQYKQGNITVAEISKEIISLSHRYFGLNEMNVEDYARMKIVNADGFAWLKSAGQFDLIINDAFFGRKTQGHHHAETQLIHEHLRDNGIYVVNGAGSVKGIHSFSQKRFYRTLQKTFRYVSRIVCEEERNPYDAQNILFFASDQEL